MSKEHARSHRERRKKEKRERGEMKIKVGQQAFLILFVIFLIGAISFGASALWSWYWYTQVPAVELLAWPIIATILAVVFIYLTMYCWRGLHHSSDY